MFIFLFPIYSLNARNFNFKFGKSNEWRFLLLLQVVKGECHLPTELLKINLRSCLINQILFVNLLSKPISNPLLTGFQSSKSISKLSSDRSGQSKSIATRNFTIRTNSCFPTPWITFRPFAALLSTGALFRVTSKARVAQRRKSPWVTLRKSDWQYVKVLIWRNSGLTDQMYTAWKMWAC